MPPLHSNNSISISHVYQWIEFKIQKSGKQEENSTRPRWLTLIMFVVCWKQNNLAVQWSLFESMQRNDMIIFRVSVVRHVEAAGLLVAASPLHLQHLPLCVVFGTNRHGNQQPIPPEPRIRITAGWCRKDYAQIWRHFWCKHICNICLN